MNEVRVLDRFSRIAPLGVRLRDAATGLPVANDLVVTATPVRRASVSLARNNHGVWFAARLPGLRDADLDPAAGSVPPRGYALAVDDPAGQFLPLRLDIALPRHGLYEWSGWAALPQPLLAPLRAEPSGRPSPEALPLFPAPARMAPLGYADIRGQLHRADTGKPAAWTLIAAEVGGTVLGLGLSDREGRFALFMAWPEWPRAVLPPLSPPFTSLPAPIPSAPTWSLRITAYSALLDPATVPSLDAVLDQLHHPRDLFASLSPLEPLAPQQLQFGRPLTLPTHRPPDGNSSFLIMAAA